MAKEYEIIWEIFNNCSNNQMRDVFFEEAFVSDTDAYVKNKIEGHVVMEKQILPDGSVIYDMDVDGIRQRMSFTEI